MREKLFIAKMMGCVPEEGVFGAETRYPDNDRFVY